jgi:N-acetyl-gamma-glutamylphosphate reductase
MINYKIIGSSNIGEQLKSYLIKDNKFKSVESNPELIFLVGTKESIDNFKREDFPNVKIIDVSSKKRLKSNTPFVESGTDILYGIPDITEYKNYYNYIANPGCSAIGSLMALYPIINFLEKNIILDVKFSKSSLTRKSHFNNQEGIMTVVHPFKHSHQKEVNYFFGNEFNIKMVPSIVDVPSGLSINLYAFLKDKNTDILSIFKNFYQNPNILISEENPFEISEIIGTTKIGFYIKKENENLFINVILDNLTIGGAYTAYLNALHIMGEK